MADQDTPFRPDVWGDGPGGLPVGGPHEPPAAAPEDPYAAHRLGTGGLDLSKDPDRYDPSAAPEVSEASEVSGVSEVPAPVSPLRGLDMSQDPDRYRGGEGQTLTGLLGEGAQEESRDTYTWLAGLVGILLFLLVVAYGSRILAQ